MDRTYRKLIYIVIGGLIVVGVFSGSNLKTIFNLKEDIDSYQDKLTMLEKENEHIRKEIEWIKTEDDYVKFIARTRLGLVESGEMKFYIVEE